MAGAASEDDAVSLNVTPLIDIIFCLCIFFICSFHFKQLQGKLDSWLPKDKGNQAGGPTTATMDEIRIFVRKTQSGPTELAFGAWTAGILTGDPGQDAGVYDALENRIAQQWDEYRNAGKTDASVIIDGEPAVPWKDVLTVLDRCKKRNIDKVEFAQPLPTNINIPK
jgi:biopolymer transport protein ExbD